MDSRQTPIEDVHHRMPVILGDTSRKMWLDPLVPYKDALNAVLNNEAVMAKDLDYIRVDDRVNSVRN